MLSENEAILHAHLIAAEEEVERLRGALEATREAKTAELFGRTPERWLDIQALVQEALAKGYGRAKWRQRAWKTLQS